jgi:hypothetical protein
MYWVPKDFGDNTYFSRLASIGTKDPFWHNKRRFAEKFKSLVNARVYLNEELDTVTYDIRPVRVRQKGDPK